MNTPAFDPATHPVEALAARCGRGEIDLPTACHLAAQPGFADALDDRHVATLCASVRHLTQRRDHRAATLVGELLVLAAASRGEDPGSLAARDDVELTWIHAVTAALGTDPDWRRYASARAAGNRVLERARTRPNPVALAGAHEELAGLHLHPLHAHYSGDAGWPAVVADWYRRGDSAAEAAGIADRYPRTEEALGRAREHYVHWTELARGHARGSALRGQVTALEWLARVRGEPLPATILELAGEALDLLDPAEDLPGITYLLALRDAAGLAPDPARLARIATVPVPDLLERFGPHNTVNALLNLAHLLRPLDPRLALALAERAAPAVVEARDPSVLARHSQSLLAALIDLLADGAPDPGGPIREAATQLLTRAQSEDWPQPRVAGALLRLVQRAPQTNEEIDALALFQAARTFYEEPFAAYPAAFRFWTMSLASGAAVNAARALDWSGAAIGYAGALREALPLGFHDFARHQLRHLVHAACQCDAEALVPLLVIAFELGLPIELHLGSDGAGELQSLASHLTERQLAQGRVNPDLLHLTWHIAKGRRFGAALRTRAAARLASAPDDLAVLDHLATLAAQVPLADQASGPGSRIDRDRRLLAFVRDDLPAAGRTPAEQLANLQQRFDRRLEQRLAALATEPERTLRLLDHLRPRLGPRTALLQLFLGTWQDQRVVVALLVSADTTFLGAVPDREMPLTEFREGARREHAYSYEEDVYLVREAILDESLDEPTLARYLHAAGGAFLHGHVGHGLRELRKAGCDHLVVVPHGPFHFAPLHLFETDGRLLADDWTVSVLPHLELLFREPATPNARHGTVAFGLGFDPFNPHRLPALEDAPDEARRIAELTGGLAWIDAQATEPAVHDALRTARHVHLATHGALNLDAPAFQVLVVAPDATHDGLIHAHELLGPGRDLDGLELVTLGACETALGRVDRADNPRGLPAAFLLAGARAVVGTLWNVAGDASRAFFVALYGALAGNLPAVEAFRVAQREVRRRFPHPRDWGAFYFLGAGSAPVTTPPVPDPTPVETPCS